MPASRPPLKPWSARTTLLTGLLTVTSAALAQGGAPAESAAAESTAAPAANTFSLNTGLASDYRYRGISQSRLKPAVSVGADYVHTSGFYVGTWISSIRWIKDAGGHAPLEWDVYGGYKNTIGATGLGYDVGLLRYQYPRNQLATSANTTEVYGALTWQMLTLKYSHALTNLFGFADSKGSGYVDLTANFDLGRGWSVVPHLGHQTVRRNSGYRYTDYAVTLNKELGRGLSASAAVVGTDANKALYVTPSSRFTGRTALVLGLKYTHNF